MSLSLSCLNGIQAFSVHLTTFCQFLRALSQSLIYHISKPFTEIEFSDMICVPWTWSRDHLWKGGWSMYCPGTLYCAPQYIPEPLERIFPTECPEWCYQYQLAQPLWNYTRWASDFVRNSLMSHSQCQELSPHMHMYICCPCGLHIVPTHQQMVLRLSMDKVSLIYTVLCRYFNKCLSLTV